MIIISILALVLGAIFLRYKMKKGEIEIYSVPVTDSSTDKGYFLGDYLDTREYYNVFNSLGYYSSISYSPKGDGTYFISCMYFTPTAYTLSGSSVQMQSNNSITFNSEIDLNLLKLEIINPLISHSKLIRILYGYTGEDCDHIINHSRSDM